MFSATLLSLDCSNPRNCPALRKSEGQRSGLFGVQSSDTYLCPHQTQVETLHADWSPYRSALAALAITALSTRVRRGFHLFDRESVPPGIPGLDSLLVAVP